MAILLFRMHSVRSSNHVIYSHYQVVEHMMWCQYLHLSNPLKHDSGNGDCQLSRVDHFSFVELIM